VYGERVELGVPRGGSDKKIPVFEEPGVGQGVKKKDKEGSGEFCVTELLGGGAWRKFSKMFRRKTGLQGGN